MKDEKERKINPRKINEIRDLKDNEKINKTKNGFLEKNTQN